MLKLRDQLYAVNYPITKFSFINYLIMGLPEEWETFKTTLRGTTRSPSSTEDHIIATIRDEDVVQLRKTETKRVYAANVHSKRKNKGSPSSSDRLTMHCSYCDKDSHTTAKCWNKPPYYCPKCKAKGHTLKDCFCDRQKFQPTRKHLQGEREECQTETQERRGR